MAKERTLREGSLSMAPVLSDCELSDDSRLLAYTSTETGSTEVFVRPFPDVDSGRWQVSTAGGMMPEWAHSGRELFFVDGSRALVAAQVETDSGFQVGEKETLFTLPPGY